MPRRKKLGFSLSDSFGLVVTRGWRAIHDCAIGAHEIFGDESAHPRGRDLGQFVRYLIDRIEIAIEKYGVRKRRSAGDRYFEIAVPVGFHLGDDAVEVLLGGAFLYQV